MVKTVSKLVRQHRRKKHNLQFPRITSRTARVIVLVTLAIGISIVLYGVFSLGRELPSPQKLNAPENFAVSTQILDRNGELLYEIYADENRTPIKLSDLPPHVPHAAIAIEDKGFYSHWGFDIGGILRAAKNSLMGESLQGGSTITQQLVKNGLLSREKTWERKLKEAILTVATEILYTKDEILEMYLNHISYGGTAWGIEAAAKAYFGKHAKDLTIGEAALLAGLPQAPSRYSPFQADIKFARNRQADVVRRMREDGYITTEQEDTAKTEELKLALSKTNIRAPHFVFYVKDQLVNTYGIDRVERGGLRVKTTLDLPLQETAQASLSAQIATLKRQRVGNGAALVTKPNTGEILAMIGSKDYFDASADGQVNVTIEERQPGSAFKPLNLAIALDLKKMTLGSMLLDIPTCFAAAVGKNYCPKNYDGGFRGPVLPRQALGNSYNIPAVKVAAVNTVETIVASASALGLKTYQDPSRYGISIGLGAGEVRMVEMAEAFGVLANQGVRAPLVSILEVSDYRGNIIDRYDPEEQKAAVRQMFEDEDITSLGSLHRVFHRAPAYLVSHVLQDNAARQAAFGAQSKLVIKNQVVSVKTGTTNNLRDNWTIGYTPEFLAVAWVGNNDATSMNQSLVSGVTGAAPIWNDIMTMVLKEQAPLIPEQPSDVITKSICTTTGLLPNPSAPCPTRNELFWEEAQPTQMETLSKEIWIDPRTSLPPKQGQSWEEAPLVLERHLVLSDPFVTEYCLDCTRASTPEGNVQYEQYVIPLDFDPNQARPPAAVRLDAETTDSNQDISNL